jgi:hypothetical protein
MASSAFLARRNLTGNRSQIGTVKVEMFATTDDVLKRVEPLVAAFERKQEEALVETVITKARERRRGGPRP